MPECCDSCGTETGERFAVHRKYVTPGSWDSEASERVLADVERWCFSCCTHYPHEPVTG